jgi:hypothetical protein
VTGSIDDVVAISLGGAACTNARVTCADHPDNGQGFIAGCALYTLSPTRAGECTFRVETRSRGVLSQTRMVEDRRSDTCCGGFEAPVVDTTR